MGDSCYDCRDDEVKLFACSGCGAMHCAECITEDVILEEWLTVKNTCGKCKNSVCYTCCNDGDTSDVLCSKCSDLVDVCTKHSWAECAKHKNQCGQCKADKNYSGRHS